MRPNTLVSSFLSLSRAVPLPTAFATDLPSLGWFLITPAPFSAFATALTTARLLPAAALSTLNPTAPSTGILLFLICCHKVLRAGLPLQLDWTACLTIASASRRVIRPRLLLFS
jgi:hypothetical protein